MLMDIWTEPETFNVQARNKATKDRKASEWWLIWPNNKTLSETEAKAEVVRLTDNEKQYKERTLTPREFRAVAMQITVRVLG